MGDQAAVRSRRRKKTLVERARRQLRKRWIFVLPFVAFVILAGLFIHNLQVTETGITPNAGPSSLIDRSVPAFDLPVLGAGRAHIASAYLKGKVTLIGFFASWCVPCRAEHPVLMGLARKNIVLIGIAYKDRPTDTEAWLGALGNPYSSVAVDALGKAGLSFGVDGVPQTYLIDKQGVIRFQQSGPLTDDIVRIRLIPLAAELNK